MYRIGILCSFLALLSACGSMTVEESIQQFAPSYCAKLKGCYATAYAAAYPLGDEACLAVFKRGLTREQLEGNSTCSDDQLDTCVQAVNALQCGNALNETPVPESCTCR